MNDGVTLADRFTSVTVIFLLGFRFWLKVVSFDIFIEIEINSRDFFFTDVSYCGGRRRCEILSQYVREASPGGKLDSICAKILIHFGWIRPKKKSNATITGMREWGARFPQGLHRSISFKPNPPKVYRFQNSKTNKVHAQTLLNLSLSGEFVGAVWLKDEAGQVRKKKTPNKKCHWRWDSSPTRWPRRAWSRASRDRDGQKAQDREGKEETISKRRGPEVATTALAWSSTSETWSYTKMQLGARESRFARGHQTT